MPFDLAMIFFYLAAGAVSGFLAGLLGLGGGVIVVPILTLAFNLNGFDSDAAMRMALGTSLGSIIFTSWGSLRGHRRYGTVKWPVVGRMLPGIVLGTILGACLSNLLPNAFLKIFFAVFLTLVALRILRAPKQPEARPADQAKIGSPQAGVVIGTISSLVGVGGGTMTIPYLIKRNLNLREAVGTSAGVILPIAFFGALGYMVNGWGRLDLPPYSLGYLYLPALIPLALISILIAPWGARLANHLPVNLLRRILGFFLLIIAIYIFTTAVKTWV